MKTRLNFSLFCLATATVLFLKIENSDAVPLRAELRTNAVDVAKTSDDLLSFLTRNRLQVIDGSFSLIERTSFQQSFSPPFKPFGCEVSIRTFETATLVQEEVLLGGPRCPHEKTSLAYEVENLVESEGGTISGSIRKTHRRTYRPTSKELITSGGITFMSANSDTETKFEKVRFVNRHLAEGRIERKIRFTFNKADGSELRIRRPLRVDLVETPESAVLEILVPSGQTGFAIIRAKRVDGESAKFQIQGETTIDDLNDIPGFESSFTRNQKPEAQL